MASQAGRWEATFWAPDDGSGGLRPVAMRVEKRSRTAEPKAIAGIKTA